MINLLEALINSIFFIYKFKIYCVVENVLTWFSDESLRILCKNYFWLYKWIRNLQNMSISRMRHVNFIYEICPINFILTNLYWIAFHEIEIESYYMNEKNLRIFSICSKSNIFVNRKVLQLDILSYFQIS